MKLPQLHMETTPAKIAIRSEQGRLDIKQPRATMDVQTVNAVIDVETEMPVVKVDLSRMWDALTGGKPESFLNRIYDQKGQYVVQAITRTVQEYDRIGNILAGGNPIADIARESLSRELTPINVYGPASFHNVSFEAIISKPIIEVQPGKVDIRITPNKPTFDFHRGGIQISMEQYPSLRITPPQMDARV